MLWYTVYSTYFLNLRNSWFSYFHPKWDHKVSWVLLKGMTEWLRCRSNNLEIQVRISATTISVCADLVGKCRRQLCCSCRLQQAPTRFGDVHACWSGHPNKKGKKEEEMAAPQSMPKFFLLIKRIFCCEANHITNYDNLKQPVLQILPPPISKTFTTCHYCCCGNIIVRAASVLILLLRTRFLPNCQQAHQVK